MMTISTLASTYPSPRLSSHSIPIRRTTLRPIQRCNFSTALPPKNKLGLFSFGRKNIGFVVNSTPSDELRGEATSSSSKNVTNEAEIQARGESTMPERFRYLTKEVPEPPVRWPYYIVVAFLVYAWRTVIWELHNWKTAATSILDFLGYLSKLFLALIFHFLGDPITSTIKAIETILYALRAFYSQIVAYTPIPEFTTIIVLTSALLAISEASSPSSLDTQWHFLTFSGLVGYLAVKGTIGDLLFWTLLFGLFSFSRFVKKLDYVSSALPVAAVLTGVGEPWVRVVFMGLFLGLSIFEYSKRQPKEEEEEEEEEEGEAVAITTGERRVQLPLLCAGLAIGVRVAAKWAGYRHLTWMVV